MRQKLISFPLFIIERDFQLGGKACCANYSIHEPFRKYVMDFTRLSTGKQGDMVHTSVGMLVQGDYTS